MQPTAEKRSFRQHLNRYLSPRVRAGIRVAMYAVIVVTMLLAFHRLWIESGLRLRDVQLPVVAATLLALVHRVINAAGWPYTLHAMRIQTNWFAATRLWLACEARRWLPGGVWGYASRATAAQRIGVDPVLASASMAFELLLVCAAALITVLPALVLHRQEMFHAISGLRGLHIALAVVSMAMAIVAAGWLLRARLTRRLSGLGARFQTLGQAGFSPQRACGALAFYVAMNLLCGGISWVLLGAVDGAQQVPISVLFAAVSAAWVVGFFAFFSPGGLVVREGTFALLLLPWLAYEQGLAIAVLSRMAQLAAEILVTLIVIKSENSD
ncbi:MAG: hypothetical protein AAFP90_09850 [Planctomycetota bacterium]